MGISTDLVKTVMHAAPVIVATGAVVLTTIEPVCQVVKGAWEKHVLKLDQNTSAKFYAEMEKQTISDPDLKDRVTKVATTVNKYRPYAGAKPETLIAGFLLGAIALKSFK